MEALELRAGRYTVRHLRQDEIPAAEALYRHCLGPSAPPPRLLWRCYERDPARACLPAAFDEEGRLVGMQTNTLRPLRAGGRDAWAAQACHTVVHPDHRGLGVVFVSLSRFVAISYRRLGACVGFGGGVNLAAMRAGTRLLGYRVLLQLPVRERRLSMRMAMRRRFGPLGTLAAHPLDRVLRRAPSSGCEAEVLNAAGAVLDELWLAHRDEQAVSVRRDAAELDWRWLRCPVPARLLLLRRRSTPVGYLALRHHTEGEARIATLLDLFPARDPATVAALLAAAEAEARAGEADFLRFAPAPASAGDTLTQRAPWRPARKEDDVVVIRTLTPDPGDPGWFAGMETVLDGRLWHYTQGDSDFLD